MEDIFTKSNVEKNEFVLARLADKGLHIRTPSILSYDEETKVMKMSKMPFSNVADYYGDNDDETPISIYDKIREIIKKLYDSGICYPDITGYNFLQEEERNENVNIWVIDFGHAYAKSPDQLDDPFVMKFLNGYNGWNPNFK